MRQSQHFPQRLRMRTEKSFNELLQMKHEVIEVGQETKHKIIRYKQKLYPHQRFLVWEKYNLFIPHDPITNLLCTPMYLNGDWGYPDEDCDRDRHYGRK